MKIKQRVYSFICLLMMSYTDLAVGDIEDVPCGMACGICLKCPNNLLEQQAEDLRLQNARAQAKINKLEQEKINLHGKYERIRKFMDMYK